MVVESTMQTGPYTYTASGDIGIHRTSMLNNELLIRDKLGKPRPRGLHLPGKEFIFGYPSDNRGYTVGDAMRSWGYYMTSLPLSHPKKQLGRDFIALNRHAVSAGLVKCKEHLDYRVMHDVRKKAKPDPVRLRACRLPSSMVFGMPTRPSTPFFDLMEHKYQDKWISQMKEQQLLRRKNEEESKIKLQPSSTRAEQLRRYEHPVEEKHMWQMPRFTNQAKPHLHTFRTVQAKEIAFKNYDMDHVGRHGVHGQGTYVAAKN